MKVGMKAVMLMAVMAAVASNHTPVMRTEHQQAFVPPKSKNSQKKQRKKARRKG